MKDINNQILNHKEYNLPRAEKILAGKRIFDYRFAEEFDILFTTKVLGEIIFGKNFSPTNYDQTTLILVEKLDYDGVINKDGQLYLVNSEAIKKVPEKTPSSFTTLSPTHEKQSFEKLIDFGEKIGGAPKDKGITRKVREENKLPAWRRKYYFLPAEGYLEIGKKLDTTKPFCVHYDLKKKGLLGSLQSTTLLDIHTRQPKVFTSEPDAEFYIAIWELAIQGFKVCEKSENEFTIYRRTSNNKIMEFNSFSSETEAKKYMYSYEGALSLLNRKKENFSIPALEKAERSGGIDYRNNKNITTEQFLHTFGFRGGEFGNWVKPKERQEILNWAYDAFMDLAYLLNLSPRALSLNDNLSISFGSRGQGPTSGTYYSGRAVININRLNGVGCLAHEWFHALDNYLGLQNLNKGYERNIDGILIHTSNSHKYFRSYQKTYTGGIRKELTNIFGNLIESLDYKKVEKAVDIKQKDIQIERRKKYLETQFDALRKDLAHTKLYKYNRSTKKHEEIIKEATAEQLEKFDTIINKILSGNSIRPTLQQVPESKKKYNFNYINEEIIQLNELYKTITGRSGFTEYSPLAKALPYISTYLSDLEDRTKVDEEKTVTVKTKTDFLKNSLSYDRTRSGIYWSSTIEMAARAFEEFILHKMDEKHLINDFLCYNKTPFYKSAYNTTPYPEGQERETFNQIFQTLFDTMKEMEDAETQSRALYKEILNEIPEEHLPTDIKDKKELILYIPPITQEKQEGTIAWIKFGRIKENNEEILFINELQNEIPKNSSLKETKDYSERNWYEHAMKRVLNYASENNFDKIAWPACSIVLPFKIKQLVYSPDGETLYPGKLIIQPQHGRPYIHIIKDSRIMLENSGEKITTEIQSGKWVLQNITTSTYTQQIYDHLLPSFLNNYCGQWNTKTKESKISGQKVHVLPLTTILKESFSKNQAMFRYIGEVGASQLDKAETSGKRMNNLNIAAKMESSGKDPKIIKIATGWERGAEGRWRYETPDFEIIQRNLAKIKAGSLTLRDIVNDEQLFTAYPLLENTKILIGHENDCMGLYDLRTNRIFINGIFTAKHYNQQIKKEIYQIEKEIKNIRDSDEYKKATKKYNHYDMLYRYRKIQFKDIPEFPIFIKIASLEGELEKIKIEKSDGFTISETAKIVLAHEIQHIIQHCEGFKAGANIKMFQQKSSKDIVIKKLKEKTKEAWNNIPEEFKSDIRIINRGKDDGSIHTKLENNEKVAHLLFRYKEALSQYNQACNQKENYFPLMTPEEQYQRCCGEVEARNVAKRLFLDTEKRLTSLASETEEIPRENQIVNYYNPNKINTYQKIDSKISELQDNFQCNIIIKNKREDLPEELTRYMHPTGRYPGVFDTKTENIYMIRNEIKDVHEIESIIKHEYLGHKGLRALQKDKLHEFLDKVYPLLPIPDRKKYLQKHKDKYRATEEYIADQAENYKKPSIYGKIKAILRNCLRAWGITIKFSENDIHYILSKGEKALERSKTVTTGKEINKASNKHLVYSSNKKTQKHKFKQP